MNDGFFGRHRLTIFKATLFCLLMVFASACDQPAQREDLIGVNRAMLSTMAALEVYRLDAGAYPASSDEPAHNVNGFAFADDPRVSQVPTFQRQGAGSAAGLTTPVAYLLKYLPDGFAPVEKVTFGYCAPNAGDWILWSAGPDRDYDLTKKNIAAAMATIYEISPVLIERTYDPTNGAASDGDVWMRHSPLLTHVPQTPTTSTTPLSGPLAVADPR